MRSSLLRASALCLWLLATIPAMRAADGLDLKGVLPDHDVIAPREVALAKDRIRRERLLHRPGKHPFRHLTELVQRDAQGKHVVVATEEAVANHLLVSFRSDLAGAHEQVAMAARLPKGLVLERRIGRTNTWIVRLPVKDLDTQDQVSRALLQVPGVASVGPDRLITLARTPDDPLFGNCWGLRNSGQDGGLTGADIGAPTAWDTTIGSRTVRVGVIDTGIDHTHPDLAANIWQNPGEVGTDTGGNDRRTNGVDDDGNGHIDDWRGWDFANDDNDPMDDHGHGTHCAGTIGAVGDDGVGVAGVCWQVSLVGLKFLSHNGSGYTSDAVAAIDYARTLGLPITSNSWGTPSDDPALGEAIGRASDDGMLFIAAAGNSGTDNDLTPFYPASYPPSGVISVAATDRLDQRAYFSCYGRTTVDLGAPGVQILSCFPGGGYESWSGTSMAAPHVAGACALLKSYHPEWTAGQIKACLLSNVDALDALANTTVSGGRLDLGACFQALQGTMVRIVGWTISDAPAQGASGNGNGIYEPGEIVAIRITLRNTGISQATGLTAHLNLAGPLVPGSVVNGSLSIGSLASGAETTSASAFLVQVDADASIPAALVCDLSLIQTSSGTLQGARCNIPIHLLTRISGHIHDISGGPEIPLSGALVTWHGPTSGTTTSSADGSYEIRGPDGTYDIQVTAVGVGLSNWVRVQTPPDQVVDFRMGISGITIDPSPIAVTVSESEVVTRPLTITNHRAHAVTVSLGATTAQEVVTTGLWHAARGQSVCGYHAWYFGIDSSQTYSTGSPVAGELLFKDVYIPASNPVLRWWSKRHCEESPLKDVCVIEMSADQGSTWMSLDSATNNTEVWTIENANLGEFVGSSLWIRFRFDSIDGMDNHHLGWLVDQVVLVGASAPDLPLGWLATDTTPITIPAGGNADIPLTVDVDDLYWIGTVTDFLRLTIVDDGVSTSEVAVSVTVTPALVLQARLSTFFDHTLGDGDWHAEAGETVQPSFLLQNLGHGSGEDLVAVMSISDPYITVTSDTASIPSIAPYQNLSVSWPLSLTVAENCPADHLVNGTLHVTGPGDESWNLPFHFTVRETWALDGTVTRSNHTAIVGATVSNGRLSTTTDAAGHYRLKGLHPGRQLIQVDATGFGRQQALHGGPGTVTWNVVMGSPTISVPQRSLELACYAGATTYVGLPVQQTGSGVLNWNLWQPITGYDVASSDDPGGPAQTWQDISGTGQELRELMQVSYATGPYLLGMPFPFFKTSHSSLRTTSYGYLSFTSTESFPNHAPLPSPAAPENLLAWHWQFCWFLDQGRAYAELVDPDTWILQCDRMFLYNVPDLVTSQVVLSRDGTITCRYRRMGPGQDCTVGIQDATQTTGALFTSDGSGLHDGMAVRFRPHRSWMRPTEAHGILAGGVSTALSVEIDTTGMAPGSYAGNIFLDSNAINEPSISVSVHLTVLAPVTISLAAETLSLQEGATGIAHLITDAPLAAPLTVTIGMADGSAEAGDTSVPSTITIPAGSSSVGIPVVAVHDADQDDESLQVLLLPGPGYLTASPIAVAVAITDDDEEEPEPEPGSGGGSNGGGCGVGSLSALVLALSLLFVRQPGRRTRR